MSSVTAFAYLLPSVFHIISVSYIPTSIWLADNGRMQDLGRELIRRLGTDVVPQWDPGAKPR